MSEYRVNIRRWMDGPLSLEVAGVRRINAEFCNEFGAGAKRGAVPMGVTSSCSTFQDLSEARFRLHQRRCLQRKHHSSAFFKIYMFIFISFQMFENFCTTFVRQCASLQIFTREDMMLQNVCRKNVNDFASASTFSRGV